MTIKIISYSLIIVDNKNKSKDKITRILIRSSSFYNDNKFKKYVNLLVSKLTKTVWSMIRRRIIFLVVGHYLVKLYLIDICLYVPTCTENLKNLLFDLCNEDLLFRSLCKIFKSDFLILLVVKAEQIERDKITR